jgi:hypothetical protein
MIKRNLEKYIIQGINYQLHSFQNGVEVHKFDPKRIIKRNKNNLLTQALQYHQEQDEINYLFNTTLPLNNENIYVIHRKI